MKRAFVLLGLLLTQGTHAKAALQNQNIDLATRVDLLIDCKPVLSRFKSCSLLPKFDTSAVPSTFDGNYAYSAKTGVTIEGNFGSTGSNYTVILNGVAFPIKDQDQPQFFPLPANSNGSLTVQIASQYSGTQTLTKTFQASISKIVLNLDSTGYASLLLGDLSNLQDDATAAKDSYELQKQVLSFFTKSIPEIERTKEELTGRPKDDFGNCRRMQDGTPSALDNKQCSYFTAFNRILLGQPSGVTELTKAKAFAQLLDSVNAFSDALDQLRVSEIVVDAGYLATLAEILEFIESDGLGG